ncbi:SixA phosphatase family protein [Psychroserpens sp.]|uniref:SixA phosphatase family protein n=1 Tax=Psychroserpens sp. TaxID=2020870 RepID=UPI001B28D72C|nr:histidine phosphatase family protein [Psychroserpens sp.]MBO6606282.1 histidine phosphatase family protein [Psychroserpens sp.]MBO6632584.1 histidine phosphatase family protein [Psychroserpens sp.]MBO6652986.1 histidine phosphatase family protein [Psychroserpens sp.]MBO6680987.1 histidine phosphatase family protein [Psychroserpens sp.]MBO6750057.1 histidine phosphatase family protein [Psychroserpens sp.]
MKIITLVRHGKSSWEFDVSDRERPLKKRGINDANLVSKYFKDKGMLPEFVFSSPANRAFSTCRIFLNNLGISDEKLKIVEDLYDFGGHQVVDFLKNMSEDYDNVMIFGHNHAFTSICNIFGDDYIDNLPTSGLVTIELNVEQWNAINTGHTALTIFPRDLKND